MGTLCRSSHQSAECGTSVAEDFLVNGGFESRLYMYPGASRAIVSGKGIGCVSPGHDSVVGSLLPDSSVGGVLWTTVPLCGGYWSVFVTAGTAVSGMLRSPMGVASSSRCDALSRLEEMPAHMS